MQALQQLYNQFYLFDQLKTEIKNWNKMKIPFTAGF